MTRACLGPVIDALPGKEDYVKNVIEICPNWVKGNYAEMLGTVPEVVETALKYNLYLPVDVGRSLVDETEAIEEFYGRKATSSRPRSGA